MAFNKKLTGTQLAGHPAYLQPFLEEKPVWYEVDPQLISKYLKDHRYTNIRVYQCAQQQAAMPGITDFHFYKDTSFFFNLVVQDETVACIGFTTITKRGTLSVRGKTVRVEQIQGKAKAQKLLKIIKWERFLLAVVVEWARRFGMSQVQVINSTAQNYWPDKNGKLIENYEKSIAKYEDLIAKGQDTYSSFRNSIEQTKRTIKMSQQKMKSFHMHYDVTPLRMGFKKHPNGYTYLDLK